jgi:hypothetical protein
VDWQEKPLNWYAIPRRLAKQKMMVGIAYKVLNVVSSVAVEIDYWYRLAKDLPEGHKAGEERKLRGASFFMIQEGRIVKLVDYM